MATEILAMEARLKNFVSTELKKMNEDLRKTDESAKRSFGRASQSAKGFSDTLKGFVGAQAIIASVRKAWSRLSSSISESVNLYKVQVQAETELKTALGFTSDLLLEQARSLQSLTTFGDEATIKAQALIGTFVKEEQQIAKVIPLVQDLAVSQFKGQLEPAATLVAKTLGSSTNALARYGIQVEGAAGSSERLNMLMENLERAMGGQAVAIAQTDIGKLQQAQNLLGDMKEDMGKEILPHAIAWNKVLLQTFRILGSIRDASKDIAASAADRKAIADVDENIRRVEERVRTATLFQGKWNGEWRVTLTTGQEIAGSLEFMQDMLKRMKADSGLLKTSFVQQVEELKKIEDIDTSKLLGSVGSSDTSGESKEGKSSEKLLQVRTDALLKSASEARKLQEKQIEDAIILETQLQDELSLIRLDGRQKDLAELQMWYDEQLAIMQIGNQDIETLEALHKERVALINEKFDEQERERILKENEERLKQDAMMNDMLLGSMEKLVSGILSLQEEQSEGAKAMSLVMATVQGAQAVVKEIQLAVENSSDPYSAIALALTLGGTMAGLVATYISTIESAAQGMDEVVRGPRLLLVGDNPTQTERVQVTPMGSPNVNGPQGSSGGGSGMTINVNDATTGDRLIRMLRSGELDNFSIEMSRRQGALA